MKINTLIIGLLISSFQLTAGLEKREQNLQNDSIIPRKPNAVKLFPTSIFFDHLALGYERNLLDRVNLQVSFGLVKNDIFKFGYLESQGYNDNGHGERHNIQGAFVKLGVKYLVNKLKYDGNQPLKGFFIMPELVYGLVNTSNLLRYEWVTPTDGDPYSREIRSNRSDRTAALLLHVGNQYVFAKSFSFEWNFGLGISTINQRFSNPQYKVINNSGILTGFPDHLYSHVAPTDKSVNGCYALNLKIGYLF